MPTLYFLLKRTFTNNKKIQICLHVSVYRLSKIRNQRKNNIPIELDWYHRSAVKGCTFPLWWSAVCYFTLVVNSKRKNKQLNADPFPVCQTLWRNNKNEASTGHFPYLCLYKYTVNIYLHFSLVIKFIIFSLPDILAKCLQKSISITGNYNILTISFNLSIKNEICLLW